MENSQKSKLTAFAEVAGILSLIVAIILGLNQWQSHEAKPTSENTGNQLQPNHEKNKPEQIDKSNQPNVGVEENNTKTQINKDKNNSEKINNFIKNYFDALMRRDLEQWSKMFSTKITRYYDLNNPSIPQIMENQRKFYTVWKFDRISIDWGSVKIEQINSDFLTTFNLNYKNKKNENDQFKNYNLLLTMLISGDFKIKSIYEMRK